MTGWLYKITEHTDVFPTAEQAEILASDRRFILVAGGEQAGKSVVASLFLIRKYFELTSARSVEGSVAKARPGGRARPHSPPLYWLVGATYDETQREFRYLAEWFGTLNLLAEATKRVDPGRIVLSDGTRIETKSAIDHRTLSKEAPDGIIGCEASQLDSIVFDRMRGRVTARNGWLFLAGTFESSVGWYPQLFKTWRQGGPDRRSFSLPSWTNRVLYPGGRDDAQLAALQADSTDDFFMERIAGRPVPPKGLVIPEIRPDVHVRDISYVPGIPVRLAIDPGYAGAYAVEALQYIDGREVIVDEIYERGLVTEEIIEMARSRPWWSDVEGGVIDVAGYQHHSMPAPAEAWMEEAGVSLSASRVSHQRRNAAPTVVSEGPGRRPRAEASYRRALQGHPVGARSRTQSVRRSDAAIPLEDRPRGEYRGPRAGGPLQPRHQGGHLPPRRQIRLRVEAPRQHLPREAVRVERLDPVIALGCT